eukprot:Opistho-1_new@107998
MRMLASCARLAALSLRARATQAASATARQCTGRLLSTHRLAHASRGFSTTPNVRSTEKAARAEAARRIQMTGPVGWGSLLALVGAGALVVYYMREEKRKIKEEAEKARTASIGRPKIGGPFSLIDQNGKRVTDEDFRDKWLLIYFGFTFCPDVCPDELHKMAEILENLDSMPGVGPVVQPLFISIDPQRDTPEKIAAYLKEFHPRLVGLTGSIDDIARVAKAHRVYFSVSPAPDEDYLVDHTIIQYLVDPDGQFSAYFGQNVPADEAAVRIANEVMTYKAQAKARESSPRTKESQAPAVAASGAKVAVA